MNNYFKTREKDFPSILFFFISVFIVLLPSCKSDSDKVSLTKHELVSFETGFVPSGKYWGVLKQDKDTFLFFADVMTKKKILFFYPNGKKIETIQLDTVLNTNIKIDDICVKSLDSVIVLGRYANQLYFINKKGIITKHIDLNPYLFIDGYKFEVYSSLLSLSGFCLNNKFLFELGIATYDKNENLTKYQYLYNFFKTKFHLNHFIQFNFLNNSDSLVFKTGFNKLYASFTPNDFIVEGSYFSFVNNSIFVYSTYSDTIFELDTDFNIRNKYRIVSDYTKLDLTKNITNIKDIDNDPYFPSILAQTCGRLGQFYYDPYRNQYYVTVLHKVNIKNKRKDRAENRPWSLLVYDKDFNKLKEFVFDGKKYYDSFIILKNGILVKLSKYNENYDKDKALFRRFTIQ